jgi:hypothetical protein
VAVLSRRLFLVLGRPLFRKFNATDAGFGAYLSRDLLGFRLKLDVKPVAGPSPAHPGEQRLQFLYNFHADLPDGGEAAARIEQHLRRWHEAAEVAWRSAHSMGEGGEA